MAKEERGFMDAVDVRQIVALVEALDRSSFDLLQLDFGRFRLTLGKGPVGIEQQPHLAPPVAAPPVPAPAVSAPTPAPVPAKQTSSSAMAGTVEVRSPVMGLFYAKPDPSSPPFVSVGTEVDEGSTVGLVEVMKVFNAVPAGAKGIIAQICVDNGQMVEIGQTLFRIRPK